MGKVELWLFEDGTKPADPNAMRDGLVWGVKSAEGTTQVIGAIYAP